MEGEASASSSSIAAHAPAATSSTAVEDELQALKERTASWKTAVSAQLNDAAAKNKKLREELTSAKKATDVRLGELRVELTQEFKERTHLQTEEIGRLTEVAEQLRKEKHALAAQHEEELQVVAKRLEEQHRVELEASKKLEAGAWVAERERLQQLLETKERELIHAQHQSALQNGQLERLGVQYKELSALISSARGGDGGSASEDETAASALAHEGGNAERWSLQLNDAAHHQQLEAVRAELSSKESAAMQQVASLQAEHEKERARVLRELHQRDEQLAVLQSLLRQANGEANALQTRITRAQTEAQGLEQRHAEKISTLSRELAQRMERVEELQIDVDRERHRCNDATAHIAALEEEAEAREDAFRALMLSDDAKQLVVELQLALQQSHEEAEELRVRLHRADEDLSAPRAGATNVDGDGGAHAPTTTSSDGVASLAEREAAIHAQAVVLERREEQLRAMETKLEEMKRSVASQAENILRSGATRGANATASAEIPRLRFESEAQTSATRWVGAASGYVLRLRRGAQMRTIVVVALLLMALFFISYSTRVVPPTGKYA